jgi:hypothetical protein
MRTTIAILVGLFAGAALGDVPVYAVVAAPTGSCSASSEGTRVQVVGSTGAQFCCVSGTWSACGATEATSTVTGGIRLTGDLSGTATSPTVVNDSHTHTATTISGLDAADVTTGTFAAARLGTYDVAAYLPGKPAANAVLARLMLTRASRLPVGLTGSQFYAQTMSSGTSTAITIRKMTNAGTVTNIGTLTFSTSSRFPSVTFGSTVDFAVGDFIEYFGPSSANAALADLSLTLVATRL